MRVPSLLAAVTVAVGACATAPPPVAHAPLQTSAVVGPQVVSPMPVAPPMALPGPAVVTFWPWGGWPGSGMGIPGRTSVFELTRFDGPESTMPGPRTLKASGGDYDSCANDYEATATVQSGSREIRLKVAVTPANRQCFASGYEKSHTFEFPLRLDTAGTYTVMAQTSNGSYRRLGSVVVQNGQIDPGIGNGQLVYEFTSFDGPMSVQRGITATVKASGGEYRFCDYGFSGGASIDSQNRTLDLSWIGTPHPPEQPRCMAMGVSHTQPFDVTFSQTGLYTVRTRTANGWKPIGSIAVN